MPVTRLPYISSGPAPVAPQGDDYAAQFAAAWLALLGDKAKGITSHPLCTLAAQRQADWLAVNDFTPNDPHRGANGSTANERLVATGFRLPRWMMAVDNVVESARREFGTPADAVHGLVAHNTHRDHMLFAGWWEKYGFCYYGVGAAEAVIDRGGWFYVCVTAPREA